MVFRKLSDTGKILITLPKNLTSKVVKFPLNRSLCVSGTASMAAVFAVDDSCDRVHGMNRSSNKEQSSGINCSNTYRVSPF